MDSNYHSTLWSMISSIFNWIYQDKIDVPITNSSTGEENILQDWEIILSTTEKFIHHQNEKVKHELTTLRRISNHVGYRSRIIQKVQTHYQILDKKIAKSLIDSRLDSSKRNRLIKDLINTYQQQWLQFLVQIINFNSCLTELVILLNNSNSIITPSTITCTPSSTLVINTLKDNWLEDKYSKNICGELLSLAFQASHPSENNGLTYVVIGDMLWAMFLCLSRQLTSIMNRTLYQYESDLLLDQVFNLLNSLITSWHHVSSISGSILERSGLLPIKWHNEHIESLSKIDQIKLKGVDAKFSDGPSDPFLHGSINFSDRVKIIGSLLTFKPPVTSNSDNTNSLSFQERAKLLESLLRNKRTVTINYQPKSNSITVIDHPQSIPIKDKAKLLESILIFRSSSN